MSKAKFGPEVYAALHRAGMSNRQIAKSLGVNEASVRRGLASVDLTPPPRKFVVTVVEA